MYIQPVSGVHPAFESWLERRRKRMQAQLSALEEERFGELAILIGDDDADRPPEPRSDSEREEYRQMLEESRMLTERLAMVRGRLLEELRDLDRERVRQPPIDRRSVRGGTLDGYL